MRETKLIRIDENGILTRSSCQLPDYPLRVAYATGTFFVQSGTNIFCGGWGQTTNECYEFDVKEWKKTKPMKTVRYWHGMTSTNDMIFVCGGIDSFDSTISTCEKFENGSWTYIQSLPTILRSQCMVAIDNDTIISIGGHINGFKVKK